MSNGYISVYIGEKQRGLKFGNYAFEMLGKRASNLFKEGEMMSSQLVSEVVYAGLRNNYMVKELEIDFSFEDVVDWVDEMFYDVKEIEGKKTGQRILGEILNTFTESKAILKGKELAETLDEESKKKLMELILGNGQKPTPLEKSDSGLQSITQ